MQTDPTRALLQHELVRRIAKNPRYSLRAFAKALGVSHTALSLVLSGKRRASKGLAVKLADGVGLPPQDRQRLLDGASAREPGGSGVHQIDLDQFELIADWHHYAVLSLLNLPGARFEERWIAARLSIPRLTARSLMERLARLGMVAEVDGAMKRAVAPLRVDNKVSTAATRVFHRQLLAKAAEVIEETAAAERNYSSMTFAMDEALVPYAAAKIRAFRRKLVDDLERRGAPNRVYNLTVQIFPAST